MLLKRAAAALLGALAVALALPYACGPVYRFPDPTPFAGETLVNPYADHGPTWQRANLHAHGRAWNGLTNGRHQSDEEIVRAYTSFGYSVPGVSNYHHIAAFDGVATPPIYEHGYNIGKRHQLAIGARSVSWFDFPLGQSASHQQFVIDGVARSADLVALAHPSTGYTTGDLEQLTGYHLIEVINGPFRFEESWDTALSAGRAVWALGNDDTHNLKDARRTAMAWTMINASSSSLDDVVGALRTGRAYAVARTNEVASAVETSLSSVALDGAKLIVTAVGDPSTFIFIGQHGAVRKTETDTLSASYELDSDDTYIRTVIRSPRTTMFLNPVYRSEGGRRDAPAASINTTGTWLYRACLVLACAALIWLYKGRRRPVLRSQPRPVLAADRETA
jgi:hypothetical protein